MRNFLIFAAGLLLLAGHHTSAQTYSEYSVELVTNTSSTFRVTRSSNSKKETIRYRTVGISGMPNRHFSEMVGTFTFEAGGDTFQDFVVSYPSFGNTEFDIIYSYQSTNNRTYRFEVLDSEERTILASCNNSITYDQNRQFTDALVSKGTDLIYFTSNGSISSGVPGKYVDIPSDGATEWEDVKDSDAYKYLAGISTENYLSNLHLNIERTRKYYNYIGNKLYAAVYFTMKEEDDGYQYIQIVLDSNSYDGSDPDGKVNDPENSVYKACFILSYDPSGSVMSDPHYQFFPHRYDYVDNTTASSHGVSHFEFDYSNSHLYQQKFKSGDWDYRAPNAGALVLTPANHTLYVRTDAAGSGDDTWYFKDLYARVTLADNVAPVLLSDPRVITGYHYRGSLSVIYLPFRESVFVTGTPTISTSWGTFTYLGGSGTNVLSFTGTIDAAPGTTLSVTGLNGTVKDMVGNAFVWPGTQTTSDYVREENTINDLAKDGEGRYLITSREDLYKLATITNAGNLPAGKTFLQTVDISCDNTYVPIGNKENPFTGTYDGGGHTIRDITVNIENGMNLGVFGFVDGTSNNWSTISNLFVRNCSFTGFESVGGIMGRMGNFTEIRNCRTYKVSLFAGGDNALCFGGIVGTIALIDKYNSVSKVTGCVSQTVVSKDSHSSTYYFGGITGQTLRTHSSSRIFLNDCLFIGDTVIGDNYTDPISGNPYYSVRQNTYYTNGSFSGEGRGYAISLGTNIGIDGEQTVYDLSEITAVGGVCLKYDNKYFCGEGTVVNLCYTGALNSGWAPTYSVNGTPISGSSFTMPAGNVTVSASTSLAAELPLSATQATVMGETKYVTTFYQSANNYQLPVGARAYTVRIDGTTMVLHQIGDDGRVIPHGNAVIVIGDTPTIILTKISSTSVTPHSGNILMGDNSAIAVTNGKVGNKTPYVLGISGGVLNFYKFTGTSIPGGKAFYLKNE